jgi:hypothetical protein
MHKTDFYSLHSTLNPHSQLSISRIRIIPFIRRANSKCSNKNSNLPSRSNNKRVSRNMRRSHCVTHNDYSTEDNNGKLNSIAHNQYIRKAKNSVPINEFASQFIKVEILPKGMLNKTYAGAKKSIINMCPIGKVVNTIHSMLLHKIKKPIKSSTSNKHLGIFNRPYAKKPLIDIDYSDYMAAKIKERKLSWHMEQNGYITIKML